MKFIREIKTASEKMFKQSKNRIIFAVVFISALSALVLLPAWLTPGGTIQIQLDLMTPYSWTLLIFLSLLISLLFLIQLHLFQQKQQKASEAIGSGVSMTSVVFGGILSTAACTSCLASVLGFLSFSSIVAIIQYRVYFIIAAIAIILLAIYFSAKKINNHCQKCN